MTQPARANILGIGVHAVNMAQALDRIDAALASGIKGYVCATGVHGIMEARRNAELRSIVNRATLVAPDGMPAVWVGWLQGHRFMNRVFGPDLMLEVCRRSVAKGYTHFLYGGTPGVAAQLKLNLERICPGIRIVGTHTPPFRPLLPDEEAQIKARFSELKPDLTWIGLSTPKQDRFMARYISQLDTRVMIGVGAAFDLHTGRLRDCPPWMKPAGLQWLHRLWQEPSRLWRRYLYSNPLFLFHIALQLSGLRRYDLPSAPVPRNDLSSISSAPADLEQRAS